MHKLNNGENGKKEREKDFLQQEDEEELAGAIISIIEMQQLFLGL